MSNKNVIQAIKVGNTINISVNGTFKQVNFETLEEAIKVFSEILLIRENPTDANMGRLKQLLNEKTRFVALSGEFGNIEIDSLDGKVYLGGFNTAIPDKLFEVIKEYHDNKFPMKPIINFWKLLMANPDVQVRESLFDFIAKHDFVLTDKGYMLVYKAVHMLNEKKPVTGTDLCEFVAEQYLKIKKWKKAPKGFTVFRTVSDKVLHCSKTEDFNAIDNGKDYKSEGILSDLHENLGTLSQTTEIKYTDKHSKTMDIRLGVPVIFERKACDSNQANECSTGLHVGSTRYVENFASAGDPILVCLVNPMNVIAVPNYDRSKMRVCEYFPIALANFVDGKIEIVDEKYFECDYISHEEDALNAMLLKIKENQLPIEAAKNTQTESRSFAELQKIIENRLVDIKL